MRELRYGFGSCTKAILMQRRLGSVFGKTLALGWVLAGLPGCGGGGGGSAAPQTPPPPLSISPASVTVKTTQGVSNSFSVTVTLNSQVVVGTTYVAIQDK